MKDLAFDLNEAEKFVTSEKFIDFLLNNTTDFSIAGFLLQVLLDGIEKLKEEEK